MAIVNNRETSIDDNAFYIDQDGQIHEAIIKSVEERDGLHYATLDVNIDGKSTLVEGVVYNTSPERNSWHHPRNPEEIKWHNEPDYYGPIPRTEPTSQQKDYSGLEGED